MKQSLIAALDQGLQRRGGESVALVDAHRPWPDVPRDETRGALVQLVSQGKAL